MNVVIVTQARYGSSRLKGKILKKICGKTLLEIHLYRLKKSKTASRVIVATTLEKESHLIEEIASKMKCSVYQGSLNDVLDRFYMALEGINPDFVVRVTSDCPLVDPELIDLVVKKCIDGNYDYVTNGIKSTYPDGFDVEVFKYKLLKKAWKDAKLTSEREHVTPFIWKNSDAFGGKKFKSFCYNGREDFSNLRLTVDEIEDFELLEKVIEHGGIDEGWEFYVDYLNKNPKLLEVNRHISRNEGYIKSLDEEK